MLASMEGLKIISPIAKSKAQNGKNITLNNITYFKVISYITYYIGIFFAKIINKKRNTIKKYKVNRENSPKKKGSSETTREAFCFDLYKSNLPLHINEIDERFLEWFIGFTEGNGSFISWVNEGRVRAGFTIDQKDPKVLYYIRSNLGFGKVTLLNKGYYRYSVYKSKLLLKLYCIFAGNLVLESRNKSFDKWTSSLTFPIGFTTLENDLKKQKSGTSGAFKITLNNAWLAGFWEASGGFSATANWNRETPNVILKAYITQDEELVVLQEIAQIFSGKFKKISRLRNNVTLKLYNRLELADAESLQTILIYFKNFGFKGNKNIDYQRWVRLYDASQRLRDGLVSWTQKSIDKIKRLIKEIKKSK